MAGIPNLYENYRAEFEAWQGSGSKVLLRCRPRSPVCPRPISNRCCRRCLFGGGARTFGTSTEIPPRSTGSRCASPTRCWTTCPYELDKVYAKAGSLNELEALLGQHQGARYRATEYIKPEAEEKQEYRDLFRAKDRIARLMGVLLLKRLESSIEAFRSTLRSLMHSNRNFREALEAGFVPIGSTATRLLSGQSFDAATFLKCCNRKNSAGRS